MTRTERRSLLDVPARWMARRFTRQQILAIRKAAVFAFWLLVIAFIVAFAVEQ